MFLGIYLDHPHFQDLHSLAQEAIKTMTSSRSYQIISGKTNVKQFRGEYFYLSHDQGGRIFAAVFWHCAQYCYCAWVSMKADV